MPAARSLGSAKISFAFVTVPVKLFTAASAKRVSFNRLHKGCGSRLTNAARCVNEDVDVKPAEIVRAFEYQPDRYVEFTDDELAAIRRSIDEEVIELTEFVPESTVDPLGLDKAFLLGPDKGCEVDYRVIAHALGRRRLAGVGMWGSDLAIVRAVDQGLAVHTAFFGSEVRSIADVLEDPPAAPLEHVQLAEKVMTKLGRDAFDPTRFTDRYADKIAAAVKRKVDGQAVIVPPPPPGAHALGLVEALRQSLVGAPAPVKAGAKRRGKAA